MQFAKDSFYMALQSRLAELNSERVVTIDGVPQPAMLVGENEPVTSAETFTDCFYVAFGAANILNDTGERAFPLMSLDTTVSYRTRGAADGSGDRGRALTELDTELLRVCVPGLAPKCDYTKDPAADMGTTVFWTMPQLGDVEAKGAELSRTAKLTLYFYSEDETA